MKKLQAIVKLQIPAGKANPSPPVGPALGQHGVNIMEFCKGFNAQTGKEEGLILPVVVSIYQDRSFTFVVKTPPAAVLLKRAAGIRRRSPRPSWSTSTPTTWMPRCGSSKEPPAAWASRSSRRRTWRRW